MLLVKHNAMLPFLFIYCISLLENKAINLLVKCGRNRIKTRDLSEPISTYLKVLVGKGETGPVRLLYDRSLEHENQNSHRPTASSHGLDSS
jgi:hypothetical protein